MSSNRAQKRQLEKARQEKAAAKRERRQTKGQPGDEPGEGAEQEGAEVHVEQDVLAELAALHERYADGGLSLEEFEESRAELVARLHVD
jgi:hypothetical protein